jgi:hypothetical protein
MDEPPPMATMQSAFALNARTPCLDVLDRGIRLDVGIELVGDLRLQHVEQLHVGDLFGDAELHEIGIGLP